MLASNKKQSIQEDKTVTNVESRKQFSPFEVLKGIIESFYKREERTAHVEKKPLTEEMAEDLSLALAGVGSYSRVKVQFYSHGRYLDLEGLVKEKDSVFRFLKIGNEKIYFDDIFKLRVI